MKITSHFLFKKNIDFNKINLKSLNIRSAKVNIMNNLYLLLFIFLTTIFFLLIILNNSKIVLKTVYFATNIRQAKKNTDISKLLLSIYPIYNEKNYIKTQKTDVANENKEENLYIKNSIFKNEYNIIDKVIEEKESINVMANIKDMNLSVVNNEKVQNISLYNMSILNYSTNRNLNIEELLSKVINLTKINDKILIYNTHTSESYANSENFKFDYTGTYRSMDANYNVLKVSKEFESNLKERNFLVYHDTTPHDYGTYTSAYAKSRITVQEAIKNSGPYGISIDLHRDALGDLTKGLYADINGVKVAQCMFVIGVGSDTNKNPYWKENLSLAIQLQKLADEYYPGLFRSMIVRNSIYNQDLNKYSFLIEVGTTGNTIDEAILSVRCISNLLNKFYLN